MQQFDRIAMVGVKVSSEACREQLAQWSKTGFQFLPGTKTTEEVHEDTECLLVHLLVKVDREVMQKFPKLKYVGVFGTSTKFVCPEAAKERGIAVRGVHGYCDTETAEFAALMLVEFARGLLPDKPLCRWDPELKRSINEKHVGIAGLGDVGLNMARMCASFGAIVHYTARTRKPHHEEKYGFVWEEDMAALLKACPVISLHTPRGLMVMGKEQFDSWQADPQDPQSLRVLINTCAGADGVMCTAAFGEWVKSNPRHYALFDWIAESAVAGELRELPNLHLSKDMAYYTEESCQRLEKIFMGHVGAFLDGSNTAA